MKLSKIYSNKKEIFDDIKFQENFNVVFAKVKKPKDSSKDSHNLGKSLLIELIDFMMLKSLKSGIFLKDHYPTFNEFIFYIEIKLNNGNFLTIKRGVANNTKISLKVHTEKNQDFRKVPNNFWDEFEITIDDAQEKVNNLLDLNAIFPWDYRKGITYFLRTQGDYRDVFQIEKFSSGKHAFWKPYMAKVLGFNDETIKMKYSKDDEIEGEEEFKEKFEKTVSVDPEEFDKLQGAIKIKEKIINEKESKLNLFNFYDNDIELIKKLSNEVEEEISDYNTVRYRIEYDTDKILESLKNKFNFDLNEIKKIYDESKIYFTTTFEKEYSELIEFNKKLQEERFKYLNEKLVDLKKKKDDINNKLINLNSKREKILSVIQDRDSFSKFKKLQSELVNEKSQLINLRKELENLDRSYQIQKKIDGLIQQRDSLINRTKEMIKKSNEIYEKIREHFNDIIKFVFNIPAILSIKINKEGNLEFNANFAKSEKDLTATGEDKGNTYRKILCAAFDLSVLMAYSDKSFFKFVYHDGILESLDNRKKILYLEKVRKIIKDYDLQYILTVINHDLPRDENDKIIEFNDFDVIKWLDDTGNEGRLFKMEKF